MTDKCLGFRCGLFSFIIRKHWIMRSWKGGQRCYQDAMALFLPPDEYLYHGTVHTAYCTGLSPSSDQSPWKQKEEWDSRGHGNWTQWTGECLDSNWFWCLEHWVWLGWLFQITVSPLTHYDFSGHVKLFPRKWSWKRKVLSEKAEMLFSFVLMAAVPWTTKSLDTTQAWRAMLWVMMRRKARCLGLLLSSFCVHWLQRQFSCPFLFQGKVLRASPPIFSKLEDQPHTSTPVDTRKKAKDVPVTVTSAQLENGAVGQVKAGVVAFKARVGTDTRAPAKVAGKGIHELNQDQSKLPSHPLRSTPTHSIFPPHL